MHVILFEDLVTAPHETMGQLHAFLCLPEHLTSCIGEKYTARLSPENSRVRRFVKILGIGSVLKSVSPGMHQSFANRVRKRPEVKPRLRRRLNRLYSSEFGMLSELLGRDVHDVWGIA